MSSCGHNAIAALAASVVMLVAAGPAAAATTGGLNGVVTDADTGLGLGQAAVSLSGANIADPHATTDASGRYLFLGLTGGVATVSAQGPAGYDRAEVPNVTLPTNTMAQQDLAIHRDWASPAGGAQVSSTDEAAAGAGCGSPAAVDTDRSTGWSSSAARAADDPAMLTVTLPQTIDVTQLVLRPGASCGHDAGTALGRYRIETSPDGTSWTTASDGELTAAQRETDVALTPTGGAGGVKFVRLVALSPQDPAATTIDVRELVVYGLGPNVPPSGTIAVGAPRNVVNSAVRLQATFTDPDSTILRYLWDFDGNGTWDQATRGPAVSHVWAGAGAYHVTVGARDFRGALGTASMDLYIIDPNVPIEAIPQRKPLITFAPPDGIDLETRIACASKCAFTAKFVLSKRTARKLHLKLRTIRTFHKKTKGPGLGSWTLTLSQKTIKRLRHYHFRKVKLRVTATAVDLEHRRSTAHRWVTFR